MIKICDAEIVIPLCLIYEKCLATGKFPEIWKKTNVLPVHKKKVDKLKITFDLFLYYLHVEKCSKSLFLTVSINIPQTTS